MSTLIAPLTGAWILTRTIEEGTFYTVTEPETPGEYPTVSSFNLLIDKRPLLQFNTNIGHTAIIDSVTITRTRLDNTVPSPFHYHVGIWAATPPAADGATFDNGDLAASEEANQVETAEITLDPALINKSGTTSIRIETAHEGTSDVFEVLTDVVLTIEWHTDKPVRDKWPFMARVG